jgi:hypothetical protein
MKNLSKFLALSLVLSTAFLAAGCPDRESIGKISANPAKYYDKEVVVAGTVKKGFGLSIPMTNVRGGVYKIDDGTGSIWVVTQQSIPAEGAQLGVKGRVQDGVNWNGKNYGLGLIENDRRFKK